MTEGTRTSVGFKRPPVHTRFQPGQSGNPRGRPRGTRNLATDLEEELAEQIPVREGERRLRVSKQRALLKALVGKALNGDTRAAGIVLQLVERVVAPARAACVDDELEADDQKILDRFIADQLRARE